jgi:hypothetical protein
MQKWLICVLPLAVFMAPSDTSALAPTSPRGDAVGEKFAGCKACIVQFSQCMREFRDITDAAEKKRRSEECNRQVQSCFLRCH